MMMRKLVQRGRPLEAIVTATGLNLQFLGGMQLEVDGRIIVPSETMTYKAMMCTGVPNLVFAIGYTNASWTLKCDLTSEYVCRLLNYMDRYGYDTACPRRDPAVKPQTILNLNSGYVLRSIDKFPLQGSVKPWKLHQNYALDRLLLRRGRVDDGAMQFSRRPAAVRT